MRSTSPACVGLFALALGAALGWPSDARAGGCGPAPETELQLVAPDGPIALEPSTGPLVVEVAGTRRGAESQRGFGGPSFAGVTVQGPSGPVAITPRELAPGLYRLEAAYTAGEHRVSGLRAEASFQAGSAPRAFVAPVIGSARHRESMNPFGGMGGRGGGGTDTRPLASIDVVLTRPAPREAWRVLLYVALPDRPPLRRALNSIEVQRGATRLQFTQGRSQRCGPNLPLGGVPPAGASIQIAWLTRAGRLSALSDVVAAP